MSFCWFSCPWQLLCEGLIISEKLMSCWQESETKKFGANQVDKSQFTVPHWKCYKAGFSEPLPFVKANQEVLMFASAIFSRR